MESATRKGVYLPQQTIAVARLLPHAAIPAAWHMPIFHWSSSPTGALSWSPEHSSHAQPHMMCYCHFDTYRKAQCQLSAKSRCGHSTWTNVAVLVWPCKACNGPTASALRTTTQWKMTSATYVVRSSSIMIMISLTIHVIQDDVLPN